jgi:hypothetical protein
MEWVHDETWRSEVNQGRGELWIPSLIPCRSIFYACVMCLSSFSCMIDFLFNRDLYFQKETNSYLIHSGITTDGRFSHNPYCMCKTQTKGFRNNVAVYVALKVLNLKLCSILRGHMSSRPEYLQDQGQWVSRKQILWGQRKPLKFNLPSHLKRHTLDSLCCTFAHLANTCHSLFSQMKCGLWVGVLIRPCYLLAQMVGCSGPLSVALSGPLLSSLKDLGVSWVNCPSVIHITKYCMDTV